MKNHDAAILGPSDNNPPHKQNRIPWNEGVAIKPLKQKSIDEQIGLNLRVIRKEKGFTQEEVAKYLNLSRVSVVNIEQGVQSLGYNHLYRLCLLYDCKVQDILPEAKPVELPREVEASLSLLPADKVEEAKRQLRLLLSS